MIEWASNIIAKFQNEDGPEGRSAGSDQLSIEEPETEVLTRRKRETRTKSSHAGSYGIRPTSTQGWPNCYKLIQLFRVTCFIAGQYNTGLLWHITGIL